MAAKPNEDHLHSPIPDQFKRALLKKYEPVLRFSAGENFFPMKIDWYTRQSELKKYIPFRIDPVVYKAGKEKLEDMCDKGPDHYLQFVPTHPKSMIAALITLIIIHAAIIIYALNPENIGQLGPALRTQGDLIKTIILGLSLAIWPLGQANRKVHLAIVLNLFGLFFFGTLPGVAFAFLSVAFLISLILLFLLKLSIFYLQSKPGEDKKEIALDFAKFLNAFFPLIVVTITAFGSYILSRILQLIGIVSGIPLKLTTNIGAFSINPALLATIFVLAAVILIPFWFYFGNGILRANQNNAIPQVRCRLARIRGAFNDFGGLLMTQITTLTMSVVFMGWVAAGGWLLGLFQTGPGRGIIWMFLLLMAASAGFWLFTHPLDMEIATPFLDPYNHRRRQVGWNINVLVGVFLAALFWAVGSTLSYLGIFHAPLLFFILSAGISTVVLGANLANYILDWRSGQLDSAAQRARYEYQNILQQHPDEGSYWYYGRVETYGPWIILHYMYFYAFNDWRSNAGGLNHHEGDWEAVTVYLHQKPSSHDHLHGLESEAAPLTIEQHLVESPEISADDFETFTSRYKPYGVAYSQHHNGVFCFWDPPNPEEIPESQLEANHRVVKKVKQNSSDAEATHPLIYVALGSHANYHWPDLYATSQHFQGLTQALLGKAEKLLSSFQPPTGINLHADDNRLTGKSRVPMEVRQMGAAVQDLTKTLYHISPLPQMVEKASYISDKMETEITGVFKRTYQYLETSPDQWQDNQTQSPPPGLPLEYAAGDGLRIGSCPPETVLTREFKWPTRLPIHIQHHETGTDGFCYRYHPDGSRTQIGWSELAWQFELADDDTPWINFQGIFGRRSSIKDEGGPSSPKWMRLPEKNFSGIDLFCKENLRLRWEGGINGLAWLDTLLFDMINNENLSLWARKRALEALTHERK